MLYLVFIQIFYGIFHFIYCILFIDFIHLKFSILINFECQVSHILNHLFMIKMYEL